MNFIKLTDDNIRNAIRRCHEVKPKVTWLKQEGERVFSVSSSDGKHAYRVEFKVENKVRLGACQCYANKAKSTCFHLAAAAAFNIYLQSQRRNASAK